MKIQRIENKFYLPLYPITVTAEHSRLVNNMGKLEAFRDRKYPSPGFIPQDLYLYSLETIKEGDNYIDSNGCLRVCKRFSTHRALIFDVDERVDYTTDCKKVVINYTKDVLLNLNSKFFNKVLDIINNKTNESISIQVEIAGDVHTLAASVRLGIEPEEVTKQQRADQKAMNFGLLYTPHGYDVLMQWLPFKYVLDSNFSYDLVIINS